MNNFASNILTKLSVKVFSHIKSLAFFCVMAESRDIAHQSVSSLLRVASNEFRQRPALPLPFGAFTPIAPCHTLAQVSQNASPQFGRLTLRVGTCQSRLQLPLRLHGHRLEVVRKASEMSPSSAYGFISVHSWQLIQLAVLLLF